ncbi:MAG TPA: ABC transporter permease [Xanthobacteraceae bacterium]|jgi:NitT/TauT family transport system permease protein
MAAKAGGDDVKSAYGVSAPKRFYIAHEGLIFGTIAVISALVLWEGFGRGWWADMLRPLLGPASMRFELKPIFISSPTRIAQEAFRMFFLTGEIWKDLGWSSFEFVLGLALALAIGIPLGLVAGWYRRFAYAVEPLLAALNATPQVALLPLLVLWLGTGLATRVLIIGLLAVMPITINALAGVRTADARLIRVARSFCAGNWFLFRSIILPGSLPFLLTGVRLAVGRAMIGIVVGEIYGSAAGIGMMINQAGSRFETDKVFVGVLTMAAAGIALVEVVRGIEQRFEAWRVPGGP